MSPTVSNVMSGGGVPSGGVTATASWTPDGTSQYILSISSYVSSGGAVPTISSITGNGLTWTPIDDAIGDNAGPDRTHQFVYVVPAGGSSGLISINWSTVPTKVSWTLDKVVGADPNFGLLGAAPQLASNTSNGSNPTATLASALQSGSVTYGVADYESSAGTLDAGTGFTSLASVTSQSLAWIISAWSSAGTTTFAPTNTTPTNRHSAILIELPAAPVAADVIVNDTASAQLTNNAATETVAIGVVLTDAPSAALTAIPTGETVTIGVGVSDIPSALLAVSPQGETVAIDVIITDTPSAAISRNAVGETVGNATVVTDTPSAILAIVTVGETVTIDTIINDKSSAAIVGSIITPSAETVSADVVINDAPSTAITTNAAGETVDASAGPPVTVTDSPSAALLVSPTGETVTIGVVVTDTPSAAIAFVATESTLIDVIIVDIPSAALALATPRETAGSFTVVNDIPSAMLAIASVGETVTIEEDSGFGEGFFTRFM